MGHSDDNVGDSAVIRLVKKLIEEAHHALCSLPSVAFNRCKLCSQKVVKLLQEDTD